MSKSAFLVLLWAGFGTPVLAQPLKLAPDVEAAYPATALPHEFPVKTAENCGSFMPKPDPATVRALPSIVQKLTDNWSRYRWNGLCHEGLLFGPGEMEFVDDTGRVTLRSSYFALRGRGVGEVVSRVESIGDFQGYTAWSYNWKGVGFSRNVPLVVAPLRHPDSGQMMYNVGKMVPDSRQSVSWSLFGKTSWSAPKLVRNALTDKYVASGQYSDRLTNYECPNEQCGALWLEHVGPVLQEYREFQAKSEPEVAALKASLQPVVASVLKQQEAERIAGEKKRVEAIAKERLVAKREETASANRERRPIATPGLDALIKLATGGQK